MNPELKTLGRPFSRLLIATAIVAAFPAYANDSAEIEKLKAQIEELDQKLRILGRKQEIAAEDAAAKQKAAPVLTASDKGFGLKSADGQFEYKLRGLVHLDYRSFGGDAFPNATDGFLARRIRPTFEGTLFGK
jgi:phosphate-selective porin OprO/OprP